MAGVPGAAAQDLQMLQQLAAQLMPSINAELGAKADLLSQKRDHLEINLGRSKTADSDTLSDTSPAHQHCPIRSLAAYRHAPRSAARVQPRSIGPRASPPSHSPRAQSSSTASSKPLAESILPASRRGNRSTVTSTDSHSGQHGGTLTIAPQTRTSGDLFSDLPLLDEDSATTAAPAAPAVSKSSTPAAVNRSPSAAQPSAATMSTPADTGSGKGGKSTGRDTSFLSRMFSAERSFSDDATGLTPADSGRSPYVDHDGTDSIPQAKEPSKAGDAQSYESPVAGPKPILFDSPATPSEARRGHPQGLPKPLLTVDEVMSNAAPVLTKEGYATYPSMKVLQTMTDEDLAQVFRFRVSRKGFGMIEWEGCTDVTGLNLDDIVNIEHQSISVYEGDVDRPPVGRGLNKPAVLTLFDIYPANRNGSQDMYFKFEEKLKKICSKRGAEFRSYDIESGEWSFRVENFDK